MRKKCLRWAATAVLAVFVVPASHAATAKITAKALRTLATDGDRFGGCMVQLNRNVAVLAANLPDPVVLNCPGSWVTFSCSGIHTTKEASARMFDSAKMGFELDKPLILEVTDEKKHQGHCYVRRIDVKKD
ncbi:MAG: hypothetical protein OXH15_22910 [Gammaproteobacteria bacterium]|nr:hypothetical protein [Gammaproteobacteria bacterium]